METKQPNMPESFQRGELYFGYARRPPRLFSLSFQWLFMVFLSAIRKIIIDENTFIDNAFSIEDTEERKIAIIQAIKETCIAITPDELQNYFYNKYTKLQEIPFHVWNLLDGKIDIFKNIMRSITSNFLTKLAQETDKDVIKLIVKTYEEKFLSYVQQNVDNYYRMVIFMYQVMQIKNLEGIVTADIYEDIDLDDEEKIEKVSQFIKFERHENEDNFSIVYYILDDDNNWNKVFAVTIGNPIENVKKIAKLTMGEEEEEEEDSLNFI